MITIALPDKLADQLLAIAHREKRPVEAVIATMVEKYLVPTPEDDLEAHLVALGILTLPTDELLESPMTEEEAWELAERLGSIGRPLSEIILEERRESY